MFFERLLCVLCFFACCVYSLSVSVFLLSLLRARSLLFSLSFFSLPFFFPSSCNSLLSSIVASTPFVAFFFFWFPSWNFFSFFLFLFHPTGRLFPRLEFGVAALRKISLLWGTLYLLRSLVRLGFLVSFFIVV